MHLDNYYASNRDLRFYYEDVIDWERLTPFYTDESDAARSWREILNVAGEYIGHQVAARAPEVDRLGTPQRGTDIQVSMPMAENLRGLADLGLMGLSVPPEYGGIGAPFVISGAVFETLARADASTMMQYAFCVAPAMMILRFGSDEQKRRWVPELTSGHLSAWVAMTEPEAGSDLGNISTTATRQADGTWRITGRKQFITNGNGKLGVLLARAIPGSEGLDGLGLFIVPRCVPDADFGEIENFRVIGAEAKVGLNGSPTCALSFQDSEAEIMGAPGEGWRDVVTFMNEARIVVAIQACGIAQASLSAAQAYAAQRVQMNKPIREHPLVAEMLLDMETSVAALRALWMEAAVAYDLVLGLSDRLDRLTEADPERPAITARRRRLLRYVRELMPLAKYFAAEEAIRITRTGMQVFGGYGVVKDYDVERFFRDSLALPIYEGTSQIQALMATKDLLRTMLRDARSFLIPGGHSPSLAGAAARIRDRTLRRLYRDALGDFSRVMQCLLVDLARKLGPRRSLRFVRTRDELHESDLEYILLSAERVTQMLAYLHTGRLLVQQAECWPERRPLARRFLQRTNDMCALIARRITRGDREALELIRQWPPVAETTDATTRSN
jgi:alkylation response protein AidB-like acyl-CoA dehydrogenase